VAGQIERGKAGYESDKEEKTEGIGFVPQQAARTVAQTFVCGSGKAERNEKVEV
jgi:hypothetical protein